MPIPNGHPEQHQRVLLRDMVHQRIRDAIMDGTLRAGRGPPRRRAAEPGSASRAPRSGRRSTKLTDIGLVEMAPNRYTRVATPSDADAITAYNTLGVILGGVVRISLPKLAEREREAHRHRPAETRLRGARERVHRGPRPVHPDLRAVHRGLRQPAAREGLPGYPRRARVPDPDRADADACRARAARGRAGRAAGGGARRQSDRRRAGGRAGLSAPGGIGSGPRPSLQERPSPDGGRFCAIWCADRSGTRSWRARSNRARTCTTASCRSGSGSPARPSATP